MPVSYEVASSPWALLSSGTNASTVDVANGGANVVIISVAFTLAQTRTVRIEACAGFSIVTATANGNVDSRLSFDSDAGIVRAFAGHNLGVGSVWWGSGFLQQQLASGAHTAYLKGNNASSVATAARFAANQSMLYVWDVGP